MQNARRRGVETLICSTLEDAGFAPGSLSAMGMFDVLEHIEADARWLQATYQLLAPGGRIYLTVPAFRALWSVDDDHAGHFRRYTLPGLRQVLESAGFQIELASYFFFPLPAPIFLFRTLASRLGLRKQEAWDSYEREHKPKSGLTAWAMQKLLGWELAWLQHGRSIPIGGSCLMVARKPAAP